MRVPTKKVVNPNDPKGGYMIVNETDYAANKKDEKNPDGFELHETDPDHEGYGEDQAEVDAAQAEADAAPKPKNADGTFDEPTPLDIRYPNKDATEFARNHGSQLGTSAAELREVNDMEQKPGGLVPEVHEAVKAAEDATKAAQAKAEEPTEKLTRRLPTKKVNGNGTKTKVKA